MARVSVWVSVRIRVSDMIWFRVRCQTLMRVSRFRLRRQLGLGSSLVFRSEYWVELRFRGFVRFRIINRDLGL